MFIYQKNSLIYIITLCFYTYTVLFNKITVIYMLQTDEYNLPNPDLIYYIRGSEQYRPCIEKPDPIYPMAKMIICNEEATVQFSNQLPIIIKPKKDNNYLISTIRIENNPTIEVCSTGTFENIMNDHIITYRGSIERKLILTGLSLHIFQHGCFKGLSDLEVLYIENQSGEGVKKLSGNLFQELKNLRNLKLLHLENIDLSVGIPQYAFYGWIKHLKIMTFINNNLNKIHDEAFPITGAENKVIELRIEKQLSENGWKLLENSNKWARYLHSLKLFSLEGTNLQIAPITKSFRKIKLKLDLGNYVNRNLEHLNIQNCGLMNLLNDVNEYEVTDVSALNLHHLGGQLKQLYIGFNKFHNYNFLEAIKKFRNLQLLSINSNQIALEKLSERFGTEWPYLKELQITSSGIKYLPANSISNNLKTLHLSENPLESFDHEWIKVYSGSVTRLNELHLNSIRLISVQLERSKANWENIFRPIRNSLEHLSLINCQLEAKLLIDPTDEQNRTYGQIEKEDNEQVSLNLGLKTLKRLKSLILSGNYLEYIPPGIFQNLRELNSLVLTQNQLLTIQEHKTEDNNVEEAGKDSSERSREQRLKRLDLSYNNLLTMERCANALGFKIPFESIIPLKPTWLAEKDDYEHRKPTLLTDYTGYESNEIYWLGGLNIIGNPFICDCRLAWFRHFVDKMSEQIVHSKQQVKKTIIFGLQKYLNEAMNFTCYGANQWTGRNFLTLTLNDLYSENHFDCQDRPDIYGKDLESLNKLEPCWKLNKTFSPDLENILKAKEKMILGSRFSAMLNNNNNNLALTLESTATSVSNEALTLIIVAGIAALCFIIMSVIIIVWLCIRLKRQQSTQFMSIRHNKLYRKRLNEMSGSFKKLECFPLSNCNMLPCSNSDSRRSIHHCCLCSCNTNPRHISSTSETNALMRPKSNRSEDSSLTPISIFTNNANDNRQTNGQIGSSIYSEVTDLETHETQSTDPYHDSNGNGDHYNKSLYNRKTKPRCQRKQSHLLESKHTSERSEEAEGLVLQGRKVSQPNLQKFSWGSHHSIEMNSQPLHTSASVQTLLCIGHEQLIKPFHSTPSAPLPPLPPPRKSKSIGDLHINNIIGSPTYSSTGITPLNLRRSAKQLAMKKADEKAILQPTDVSISLLRHYDTKKKRSPITAASIRRSTLPWRDRSTDNNETMTVKTCRSLFANSRTSLKNAFRRNRLVVSARPRLENNEKNGIYIRNNWLSASRRKLQQTCEWLKRDRMPKTRNSDPLTKAQQRQQSLVQQIRSQDDAKFLGPELPKPFFLISKQEAEYAIPNVELTETRHTDYLPMCHEKYKNNRPTEISFIEKTSESGDNLVKSTVKKSPVDEYVTDLMHIQHVNYPNMVTSNSFRQSPQLPPVASPKKTLRNVITEDKGGKNDGSQTAHNNNNNNNNQNFNNSNGNNNIGNDNNNIDKPVRPPRHQKLQISGNLYSIQTFSNDDSHNNTNTQHESNKNKKNDKYWPLDYELPPPPPPPPFMLNKTELTNANVSALSNVKINQSTSLMNDKNSSLSTLPPPLSPKPRNTNVKPLRSAKINRVPINDNDIKYNSLRRPQKNKVHTESNINNENTGVIEQEGISNKAITN